MNIIIKTHQVSKNDVSYHFINDGTVHIKYRNTKRTCGNISTKKNTNTSKSTWRVSRNAVLTITSINYQNQKTIDTYVIKKLTHHFLKLKKVKYYD